MFLFVSCMTDKSKFDTRVEIKKINNKDSVIVNSIESLKINDDKTINESKTKRKRFKQKFNFENFKVVKYSGSVKMPIFKENPYAGDKEYVNFITKGCSENGVNFAGHYTLIERDCGCMCLHAFIVDRSNGKIFINTNLNEGKYGYKYQSDSRLIIANSELFIDDKMEFYNENLGGYTSPEIYMWNDSVFVKIN